MSQPPTRARVACKLCNARRVRCDRSETKTACSNCQMANTTCELIVSRRGKHKRFQTERRPRDYPTPAGTVESPRTTLIERRPGTRMNRRDVSPSLPDIAVHKDPGSAGERVVYIGDSANFRYVLNEVGDPYKGSEQNNYWIDNLQRCMIEHLGKTTEVALQHIRCEDDERLKYQGVFQYPEKPIRDELIRVFFDYSYPTCPIFDRADFTTLYKADRLSPLLLNAVLFIATLHCSNNLLSSMGFVNRYLASLTFYRRAKALYDANYESDGIVTVQASILLSHRWDGPMEQKDTWHWLGVAAGLAQSLGMHRRRSYSTLPASCQMLWRRIWWILYIHDVHHSAIYGRPPHINPDFCDVDPLHESDFDDPSLDLTDESLSYESRLYPVLLAELSCRAARCIIAKYSSADGDLDAKRRWYNELLNFQNILPPQFAVLPSHITLEHGFWPALIHLYHLEYQVVFYRGLTDHADNSVLVGLAGKITRILEDMLASGILYQAPFHVLPAIFSSTTIHIIQIHRAGTHTGVLSQHRALLALDILEGFQDAWPHVIYTRNLLERLLKNLSHETGEITRQHSTQNLEPTRALHVDDVEEEHAYQDSSLPNTDPPDDHVYNLFLTPVMPMFSFNNLAEDVGLGPDFWTLDQVEDNSF